MAEDLQQVKLERLMALSDDQLLKMHLSGEPGFLRHETEREMERRQLVASRELRSSIDGFKTSADRSAKWMLWLTAAIALLTVVTAVLAVVTVWATLRGSSP
jgi:hypothetical protein